MAGALIGFGLGWKSKPAVDPETQDLKFSKVYNQIDSLKKIITDKKSHIDTLYKEIHDIDVNRNNNFKNLANEIKQIKRFTSTSRSRYLDSLATVQNIK